MAVILSLFTRRGPLFTRGRLVADSEAFLFEDGEEMLTEEGEVMMSEGA